MHSQKRLVVSHAPFWHDGGRISTKNYHIMLAALPALVVGISRYGAPAFGVVAFSMACAMIWELLMNLVSRRPISIGDGSAALIGLLLAMLLPATTAWWIIATGTFVAVIVGRQIFGGIGANPFNPVVVSLAILTVSWGKIIDFDASLIDYDLGFAMAYPLAALKHFGVSATAKFSTLDLFLGRQSGGIGATFGLGLILGGLYLILRGFIRWEISLSFIIGVWITALIFHLLDANQYAGPMFHLLTGYTLIGAFFLATEDASSPVHLIPMFIFGLGAGAMTVLIRNKGAYADGVIFAILLMNVANPLLDKLRPKAMGRVVENA